MAVNQTATAFISSQMMRTLQMAALGMYCLLFLGAVFGTVIEKFTLIPGHEDLWGNGGRARRSYTYLDMRWKLAVDLKLLTAYLRTKRQVTTLAGAE
jgi:hypothetical protein